MDIIHSALHAETGEILREYVMVWDQTASLTLDVTNRFMHLSKWLGWPEMANGTADQSAIGGKDYKLFCIV